MKQKYPNLMMQSASNYNTHKVKEDVAAQVQEEKSSATTQTVSNIISENNDQPVNNEPIDPVSNPDKEAFSAIETSVVAATTKPVKPKLRQQAYYLTEIEIKTIKRLSYELDIPKSDLVRKFIDEGIAKIESET